MEPSLLQLLVPAASGFVGVLIGAWLSSRRDRSVRRLAFVEKQLASFYSPMLGIRQEIAAISLLRSRIQEEADKAWRDLTEQARQSLESDAKERLSQKADAFNRVIGFDNDKLHKELLPAYRRLANLFRDNYWLAEKETRIFYPAVLAYVEIWERWVAETLPVEVWRRLDHSESHLVSFYEHIAQCHDRLREKLERGAA
jgi:predicted secreted protein